MADAEASKQSGDSSSEFDMSQLVDTVTSDEPIHDDPVDEVEQVEEVEEEVTDDSNEVQGQEEAQAETVKDSADKPQAMDEFSKKLDTLVNALNRNANSSNPADTKGVDKAVEKFKSKLDKLLESDDVYKDDMSVALADELKSVKDEVSSYKEMQAELAKIQGQLAYQKERDAFIRQYPSAADKYEEIEAQAEKEVDELFGIDDESFEKLGDAFREKYIAATEKVMHRIASEQSVSEKPVTKTNKPANTKPIKTKSASSAKDAKGRTHDEWMQSLITGR